MPVSGRPVSGPTQYGRPTSAPAGPPGRQGAPASVPPGYAPSTSGFPGSYGPQGSPTHPGAPGMFAPQQNRYPEPGTIEQLPGGKNKKKKRSLWDAFMGDLGKNKRNQGRKSRSRSPESPSPLAAYGSLDHRLGMSEGVLQQQPPGFRVEDGVVVPDDARLKKARRRGPGMGGGRWQRFAFLTAMLLAMALLMALGVARLVAGAPTNDAKLSAGTNFPSEGAAGYVERFTKIFFSWNEGDPPPRQNALATYFPAAGQTNYGWNTKGHQEVSDMPVTLHIDVENDHRAVITTGASVVMNPGNPKPDVRFLCSATSVYAANKDSYAIDSYPALVACPPPAAVNVKQDQPDLDSSAAAAEIKNIVEKFFTAYATNDSGTFDLVLDQGANVTAGLNGDRKIDGKPTVRVVKPAEGADASLREVRVQVNWLQTEGGSSSSLSEYAITAKLVGGSWKIAKLRPALPSADLQPETSAEQRKQLQNNAPGSTGANSGQSATSSGRANGGP